MSFPAFTPPASRSGFEKTIDQNGGSYSGSAMINLIEQYATDAGFIVRRATTEGPDRTWLDVRPPFGQGYDSPCYYFVHEAGNSDSIDMGAYYGDDPISADSIGNVSSIRLFYWDYGIATAENTKIRMVFDLENALIAGWCNMRDGSGKVLELKAGVLCKAEKNIGNFGRKKPLVRYGLIDGNGWSTPLAFDPSDESGFPASVGIVSALGGYVFPAHPMAHADYPFTLAEMSFVATWHDNLPICSGRLVGVYIGQDDVDEDKDGLLIDDMMVWAARYWRTIAVPVPASGLADESMA